MKEKKEIWIVEDDDGIAEVTSLILEDNNYNTLIIPSFQKLKENFKLRNPSLILLDLNLHDCNGVEVSKVIKNDVQTKDIPIIIMSADIQIESKVLEAGADDYLKKPFDLNELLKKIDKNLSFALN